MRSSQQQGRDHDNTLGTRGDTGLHGLCHGRSRQFEIAIIQAAASTLTHQGNELLKFPYPIRVSTAMPGDDNGIICTHSDTLPWGSIPGTSVRPWCNCFQKRTTSPTT